MIGQFASETGKKAGE
ncbi:hypothetical protein [[Ruminococcus] lactaris]|nr:hypothetical protein [[Ruminococcus] lactaris]